MLSSSNSAAASGSAPNFTDLLRDSLSLVKHIDNSGVPIIARNLTQLALAARKLQRNDWNYSNSRSGGDQNSSQTITNAQLFLAATGVDIASHSRLLRDIELAESAYAANSHRALADSAAAAGTGTGSGFVDSSDSVSLLGFLGSQHSLIVDSAIAEAGKMSENTFKRHLQSRLDFDWSESRKLILDSIGFRSSKVSSVSPKRHFSQISVVPNLFSRVVKELNSSRRSGSLYRLADEFALAAAASGEKEEKNAEIKEVFEIIKYLIGESADSPAARENQFAINYQTNERSLRLFMIAGAKHFNEELFLNFMKSVVRQQSQTARMQGKPGILTVIQGFLNCIRHQLPTERFDSLTADGFPLWCTMFYCLRVGQPAVAIEIADRATRNNNATALQLRSVIEALKSAVFLNGSYSYHLSVEVWDRLNQEFLSEMKDFHRCDPFKIAVYHVIGRFKLENPTPIYQLIADSAEDYIWLKLSLVFEFDSPIPKSIFGSAAQSSLSLSSLQDQLLKRGEQHFSPDSRKSLVFFRILLFSQQFESAINYLLSSEEYFPVAVHAAIALDHYGLIRRTEVNEELFKSTRLGPAINLYTIVRKYVESNSQSDPCEAAEYYYSLRDNAIPSSLTAVSQFFKDLILESRDYELLIGVVSNNQIVSSGCIHRLFGDEFEARKIIQMAAQTAEKSGLIKDAIQLFTLAHSPAPVCELLITELSRLAATRSDSVRHELIEFSSRFLQMNASNSDSRSSAVNESDLNSLGILWEIVHFFDLFHLGPAHFDDALDIITQLNLFPLSEEWNSIDSKSAEFHSLHPSLRKLIGSIALSIMEIYHLKFEFLKKDGNKSIAFGVVESMESSRGKLKSSILDKIRSRARAMVNFVGINQNQIGNDIHAKLLKLESFMA